MTRLEFIKKVSNRRKQLKITIENLAKLSNLSIRTINRLLAGDDIQISTIEKITNTLGLDFAGNETISLKKLKEQRAKQKAIFLASLVQSTSALEKQGLDENSLNRLIFWFEKELLNGEYKNSLWVA